MKKKILIASFDSSRRDTLAALLTLEGYEAFAPEPGRRAAKTLAANPVSLMIVDFAAPSGSPCPGCPAGRTLEALTDIDPFLPLLLLCESPDDLDHDTSLMADKVLSHPVEFPALLDAIATLLSETLRERVMRKSGHVAFLR